MSQRSLKYKIDGRTARDIEKRLKELASSYTPEWHFLTKNPDIGSTIGRIYASQIQENIRAVNNVLDIYHAEFVNLLDLTLKSAVPAGSVVCFYPVDSVSSGTLVPKGTRIIAGETNEEGMLDQSLVFETDRNIYVTTAKITDAFLTDRESDVIAPVLGNFVPTPLFDPDTDIAESGETEDEIGEITSSEEETLQSIQPFILFGERESIGRHALLLYHPAVFNTQEDSVYIRFVEGEQILRGIASGYYRFCYLTKKGPVPYDDYRICEDGATVRLIRHDKALKTRPGENDERMDLVVLEATGPVTETATVRDVKISCAGDPHPPVYVGDGSSDFPAEEFAPFTDTLSNFAECYIGAQGDFDKAGCRVTLDFHLTVREHPMEVPKEQAESELKIIKRKAKAVREEAVSEAYADEISLEYFNGIGWRRLKCETQIDRLFAAEKAGQYEISFICPDDWGETESGSYQGRVLRLRLMRSDNCYLRPAIHHYPVITGLTISYSYRQREVRPYCMKMLTGTRLVDITAKSRQDDIYPVFTPFEYTDDALYLGFDTMPDSGPLGILFRLGVKTGQTGVRCRFEYSTRRGFKQFKVADGTEGFTRSGILLFMPPSDFHATTLEDRRRYWLRIVRDKAQHPDEREIFLPHVEDIRLNAMSVTNAVSGDEEEFYIDEVEPNMHFFLGATNILDADVWVNERADLSGEEMRTLLKEHPEDVRAEYDLIGNISSLFVRWQETEQFDNLRDGKDETLSWKDLRCYRIDRLTGEILFGDGIHTKIPRVTDDVAFRVRLRTCAGEAGNVPVESISTLQEDFIFIDGVVNPIRAYGGSNMESVQQALLRGADRIHSRSRLVSMPDYLRTIKRFSGVIDKVAGITGRTIDGQENPAELSFVLLMKDYADGAFSFHRIEAKLMNYLLSACELTVAPHRLHIVEPIFVSVSVSVWTEVMNIDDSFEVQNQIRDLLNRYLDPVTGGTDGSGWEIGVMPKSSQIRMRISVLKNQAMIRKTSITASYTDWDGEHETDFSLLKINPFMVCIPGEHQVHILYDRSEKHAEN